ncbi:MAG: hypothetical protein AB7U98_05785 [Candidatus Nitrosocosmicus sp.]
MEIYKERFNLNEKIQNVIKDITKKYNDLDTQNRTGDQVKIVYQQEIDPIPVYDDKIRIFEVLSNLLNNAIKLSEGNPINITVEIVPNTQNHEKDSKTKLSFLVEWMIITRLVKWLWYQLSIMARGSIRIFCLGCLQNLLQNLIKVQVWGCISQKVS